MNRRSHSTSLAASILVASVWLSGLPFSGGSLFADEGDDAGDTTLINDLIRNTVIELFTGPAILREGEEGEQAQQIAEEGLKALALQFDQQYRPLINTELEFLRLVCDDLTPEQRKSIRDEAEAALKKVSKAEVARQNGVQGLLVLTLNQGNTNPREVLRKDIWKHAKKVMNDDQYARSHKALEERLEMTKTAAISGVVTIIDHHLYLSSKQREEITDVLKKKWKDWEKWMAMSVVYGEQFLPTLPDNVINPLLTPEQKVVWKSIPRQEFEFWGSSEIHQFNEDEWWGPNPEPKEEGDVPALEGTLIRLITQ